MNKFSKKKVLGRGLASLLKEDSISDIKKIVNTEISSIGSIVELPIDYISTNPNQPRLNFNDQKLIELATSIGELGIIQPITVRKINSKKFELISGERRLRASKQINLKKIPCFIKSINDQESLEMALVENIQREDLDSIEIALSYKRLIEEIQLTQNELSDRIGKKRSTISNYLRLLKLDPIIQSGIRDEFISMGHGRALIGIENNKTQIKVYEKILKKGLSVRNTEKLIKNLKIDKSWPKTHHKPKFILTIVKKIESILNTKVNISADKNGKGVLKISFDSQNDLERIINKIKDDI
ncbi:MAG: chromosome partitioning protein ParB [Flavobacteriaceae bacterium]|nr:chromosome partitioning protein ParB [Flavobacteriaceae bacterium]|tara:strand:- start:712 stop:1605 length:894 start_codon:yes stop_codon:yes gene_type:complete